MLAIGPGSTLAGRYAVRERRAVGPGWERWSALDLTLDREVVLLTFPRDSPHADATLDAARRAASATDPRLTQVLDASGPASPPSGAGGPHEGAPQPLAAIHYIVESPHPGARSLRSIIADGPIPDDEARRIAGEVAMALTEAGRIGLHHGDLSLGSVLIDPQGAVIVRGMATEAALRGLDTTGEAVTTADARAIVALLYAALTTRWPLTSHAAARRLPMTDEAGGGDESVVASVVASVVESSGVAADGTRTGEHGGDRTEDDAPAPRISGVLVPASELVPGVSPALDAAIDEVLGPEARPMRPQDVAAMIKPWSPYPLVDLHSDLRRESLIDPLSVRTDRSGSRSSPPPTPPAFAPTPASVHPPAPSESTVSPASPTSPDSPASPTSPGSPVPSASPASPELSGVSRASGDPATPATPAETVFEDAAISQVLSREPTSTSTADPLLPDLGAPTRKESRLALGIIGGLVLLLALLGIWGVSRMGSGASTVLPQATSRASSGASNTSDTPSSTPATGSTPDATTAGSALTPVPVTAGTAYEPQNGGSVASKTAVRAYDGKLDTLWVSNAWYQTDKFGGLPIPGLGLVLDVGQPTPLRQVTVTVPTAQDFTVSVGGAPTPEGATVIGSVTGQSGPHTFSVPEGTADARYVIVYVTRLGAEGQRFRAQVAEVAIAR